MKSNKFFFFHDKQWKGPFTYDALCDLYKTGKISDDTLVKSEGGKAKLAYEYVGDMAQRTPVAASLPGTPVFYQSGAAAQAPKQQVQLPWTFSDGAPYLPFSGAINFQSFLVVLAVLNYLGAAVGILVLFSEGVAGALIISSGLMSGTVLLGISNLIGVLVRLAQDTHAVRWHVSRQNQPKSAGGP